MHFWSQFLTDFHIWSTKSKLRTSSTTKKKFGDVLLPVRGLKMAKNILKTCQQTIFSCRGGSKLQFGGSYVKISQELASEMSF